MVFWGCFDELESGQVREGTIGWDSNGSDGRAFAMIFVRGCSSIVVRG